MVGGADRWVIPQVVPSSRRLTAFRAHAVPKLCDTADSDHCAPVPVPKRAHSRITDPAFRQLCRIHSATKARSKGSHLADGTNR